MLGDFNISEHPAHSRTRPVDESARSLPVPAHVPEAALQTHGGYHYDVHDTSMPSDTIRIMHWHGFHLVRSAQFSLGRDYGCCQR
eukprot:3241487-Pyramimonas_sp.AAC.1